MNTPDLRALRRRLGVTQADLAAAIDVAPNTVARWERGELGMRPATAKLIRILASTMTPRKMERR